MELARHRHIAGMLQPTGVRAAQAIWIAFVLVQALDGVLTLVGMHTFGLRIEANPLIAWYAHALGPEVAVSAAKLFAVGCGVALYLTAHYRTIAALALTYVLAALGPWIHVFLAH
jgi:hypothetical protein